MTDDRLRGAVADLMTTDEPQSDFVRIRMEV